MKLTRYGLLSLCFLSIPVLAQQNSHATRHPLVDGKLIYVGKMPENLDGWIVDGLSAWGKYKPTRQIEGVDLAMKAYEPQMEVQYKMDKGIPRPKEVRKDRDRKHVMFSIIVDDWVTGKQVWKADIMDQKPNRDENNPSGPDAEINAGGLSSQQVAQAVTRELRRYVDHLSSQSGVQ